MRSHNARLQPNLAAYDRGGLLNEQLPVAAFCVIDPTVRIVRQEVSLAPAAAAVRLGSDSPSLWCWHQRTRARSVLTRSPHRNASSAPKDTGYTLRMPKPKNLVNRSVSARACGSFTRAE